MKAYEITKVLEQLAPKRYACDWDNVGMHVGREDREVKKALVAVDADERAIARAVETGAQMIISHHPLLFHGIRQVNDRDFLGQRVLALTEHGINCYCMHTNFDTAGGMAAEAAKRLSLQGAVVLDPCAEPYGIGQIGDLAQEMTLKEVCMFVKERFGLSCVSYYGEPQKRIRRIAVVPGSGKDEIPAALEKGAQVLITGDITYHYGTDAKASGLAVIDAGHYGLEQIFTDIVSEYLKERLPGLLTEKMEGSNPQQYI